MNIEELAAALAAAAAPERAALLAAPLPGPAAELARALRRRYLDLVARDPAAARNAAAALRDLASLTAEPEAGALADWVEGLVALQIDGRMEQALARLDAAAAGFEALGQALTAGQTLVARLAALAMLGRYEEAAATGERARTIFLAFDDQLAAGKIEQNLGNLYHRRDQYAAAEAAYRAARARFAALGDQRQLAQIDNCLGIVLTLQHQFTAAAEHYDRAVVLAEAAGLAMTQAEIECSIGGLALAQGRYDRALDYLERSRRHYAALNMRHESAMADQEMADAYMELNLAPEAAEIYGRVAPTFAELGLRAEQARVLANHGRAALLLGQLDAARTLLAGARTLYAAEGNAVGAAIVTLTEASLAAAAGDDTAAVAATLQAEAALAAAGALGRLLLARWLRGDALRRLGQVDESQALLAATLDAAQQQALPQIVYRCETSLGLLAAAAGDPSAAEAAFKRAVAVIEDLRAPLPAEEFRTAFIADKLTPYSELVRLCLADASARVAEAFSYVERARSRALVELLGGALPAQSPPRDAYETDLLARLAALRDELNWFYSQINRRPGAERGPDPAAMADLYTAAREREADVLAIMRQLRQQGQAPPGQVEPVDLARLQASLGTDTALIEYAGLDGELLAFVVTADGLTVVRDLGSEEAVEQALSQLRFQFQTLRYGAARLRGHLAQLTDRARHYLAQLYDRLLRPLAGLIGGRRLIIAPYRSLHYIPFHALHDGEAYVIERRAVSYTPSAGVLQHCLAAPRRPLRQALLLGVADEQTPQVRTEVAGLAGLFPAPTALLDAEATLAALQARAPAADLLHLACHGQFRPDNPLFSSVRLADGWLTVRDAAGLHLQCELVTLSACETGVSALAPGDELIGLARGFFAAGVPALLVSLWTVDDSSTAALMAAFYRFLQAGAPAAEALQAAQREVMQQYAHPFFWSPFVLLGRP